jgi:uncharacterized protein (DUF1810 family)
VLEILAGTLVQRQILVRAYSRIASAAYTPRPDPRLPNYRQPRTAARENLSRHDYGGSLVIEQVDLGTTFQMREADGSDDLQRFIVAQECVYTAVEAELRMGRKQTHWMWFIFPQLRGLGSSAMAHRYGIDSLAEARAYLEHPLLGDRLRTCTSLVLAARGRTLREILGEPDDMKFRSSMTLFSLASSDPKNVFCQALELYCDGHLDEKTLALLPR